jgi:hypothetical protein
MIPLDLAIRIFHPVLSDELLKKEEIPECTYCTHYFNIEGGTGHGLGRNYGGDNGLRDVGYLYDELEYG